ncbi:hypothetical protein EJ06DRAFT_432344 [Trichodelitschia bisporula]|uniref:Uncharacterized protein n=1 Tax=Trichodelitschia bisporula TaxID=703511 RepID=A0A6G1HWU5_9PEZI|nr:hypothetical protein EJ06DRAFT_432344 [Trichodelitschia bisporula]
MRLLAKRCPNAIMGQVTSQPITRTRKATKTTGRIVQQTLTRPSRPRDKPPAPNPVPDSAVLLPPALCTSPKRKSDQKRTQSSSYQRRATAAGESQKKNIHNYKKRSKEHHRGISNP